MSSIPESDSTDSQAKWKQLSDLALATANLALAHDCSLKAGDLGGLLLLHSASGACCGCWVAVFITKGEVLSEGMRGGGGGWGAQAARGPSEVKDGLPCTWEVMTGALQFRVTYSLFPYPSLFTPFAVCPWGCPRQRNRSA
jgi:hypothetical protein